MQIKGLRAIKRGPVPLTGPSVPLIGPSVPLIGSSVALTGPLFPLWALELSNCRSQPAV